MIATLDSLLVCSLTAQAQPQYPLTLSGGGGGMTTDEQPGLQLSGRMVFHLGKIGADLGLREGLSSTGTVGAIFAGPRYSPVPGLHLRTGFAHHHETPMDIAKQDALGAIAGVAPGIVHRSGLEVGLGVGKALSTGLASALPLGERLGWEIDLGLSWMLDDGGPPVTGWLGLSGTIGVGQAG